MWYVRWGQSASSFSPRVERIVRARRSGAEFDEHVGHQASLSKEWLIPPLHSLPVMPPVGVSTVRNIKLDIQNSKEQKVSRNKTSETKPPQWQADQILLITGKKAFIVTRIWPFLWHSEVTKEKCCKPMIISNRFTHTKSMLIWCLIKMK